MPAKTVTITGGSGFVGQLLRRGLKKRGYQIRVFDKSRGLSVDLLRHKYLASARYPGVVRGISKRINRLFARTERTLTRVGVIRPTLDDILGPRSQIAARFHGSYAVIHLAAFPHPNVPGVSEAEFHRVNYDGAVNIFEAAREAGVPKFIFASSGQVYGINKPVEFDQFPIEESNYCPTLAEGQNLYGHLKLRYENYLAAACKGGSGIQAIALRLEYPGIRSKSPLNLYISTSIENLVAGFACAIEANIESGFEAFNIADAQVDERIVDIQRFVHDKWPCVPNRTTGNQCLLSTEKARRMMGYSPSKHGSYVTPAAVW
jgi:dTDP-4-dehydrorhamnose reductase